MNNAVALAWKAFRHQPDLTEEIPQTPTAVLHFCDNEQDANECAELVVAGRKRATCCSLAELETEGVALPKPGEWNVVTDWSGQPVAIIRTVQIEFLRFREVTEEHAAMEGEGDGSLQYWRTAHEAYFRRVLTETQHQFHPDMQLAFEQFELVQAIRD